MNHDDDDDDELKGLVCFVVMFQVSVRKIWSFCMIKQVCNFVY